MSAFEHDLLSPKGVTRHSPLSPAFESSRFATNVDATTRLDVATRRAGDSWRALLAPSIVVTAPCRSTYSKHDGRSPCERALATACAPYRGDKDQTQTDLEPSEKSSTNDCSTPRRELRGFLPLHR